MALTKILEGGIADDAVGNTKLDLAANYAFTGTVTGAGMTTPTNTNAGTNASTSACSTSTNQYQQNR